MWWFIGADIQKNKRYLPKIDNSSKSTVFEDDFDEGDNNDFQQSQNKVKHYKPETKRNSQGQYKLVLKDVKNQCEYPIWEILDSYSD